MIRKNTLLGENSTAFWMTGWLIRKEVWYGSSVGRLTRSAELSTPALSSHQAAGYLTQRLKTHKTPTPQIRPVCFFSHRPLQAWLPSLVSVWAGLGSKNFHCWVVFRSLCDCQVWSRLIFICQQFSSEFSNRMSNVESKESGICISTDRLSKHWSWRFVQHKQSLDCFQQLGWGGAYGT